VPVYHGPFRKKEAERLLWRAGFGPKPGEAVRVAAKGLKQAVDDLVYPPRARLVGRAPTADGGEPLAPRDAWGHDHLWWLDRMVRSNRPLVERMTLVWHDWFATSNAGVGSQKWMLNQNAFMRKYALGSFESLLLGVTRDPATLIWLNGRDNTKWDPNENYARELMELFTLGAGLGYTEDDVREQARALTGWRNDWQDGLGDVNFRYDPTRHDNGIKVVFGKSGNFGWEGACRLCLQHPRVTHRVAEPVQRVPEPGCVAGGAQPAGRLQRVLQNRHQQARLASLVVVLIEKYEKRWERPRGVVRFDALGERGEVSVHHLGERRLVECAGARERRKVVDPENVVRPGVPDHPQQLPVKLQVGDVREPVVLGELDTRNPFEQRIELGLVIMFFGEQAVLQRQPYETRIVPFLRRLAALRFEDVRQPLEDEQDVFRPSGRHHAGRRCPAAESAARGDAQGFQGIVLLLAPQQPVIGDEDFVEHLFGETILAA